MKLTPFFARSIINVSNRSGSEIVFNQVLTYDYEDLSGSGLYIRKFNDDERFRKDELETLKRNMQAFLDDEINVINDKEVRLEVDEVSVSIKTYPKYVYFSWYITWSGPSSDSGIQEYEARVEPAILEYDVESIYIFPKQARILDVKSALTHDLIKENIIRFRGNVGDKVREIERIVWKC
ncbi:MAG: hypothetical protein ACTSVI_04245 [Promethearchaeota archaeon]